MGFFLTPFLGQDTLYSPQASIFLPQLEKDHKSWYQDKCFLPPLSRGSSHVCVVITAGSRFLICYLPFLHFFLESIVFYLSVIISSDGNVAGTLICMQNICSGSVCCCLWFSGWEFLLAPVNVRGRVGVNQICPFLQRSAELKAASTARRPFLFVRGSEVPLCLWRWRRGNNKGPKSSGMI